LIHRQSLEVHHDRFLGREARQGAAQGQPRLGARQAMFFDDGDERASGNGDLGLGDQMLLRRPGRASNSAAAGGRGRAADQ
jgi:hypothetical protein